MNLVHVCPDIPDHWKGGVAATAKLLGISKTTLYAKVRLGKRLGGIDATVSKNGYLQFHGREVKRFWREYR